MDKSKKIDILHIQAQVAKLINEWLNTKDTGVLSIEICFYEGGIRGVDVDKNTKFKIK